MTSKKKICFITGSRAEYGLLQPLMEEVRDDPDLELQVVATGQHLSPEFGFTYRQIEADGFCLADRVDILSNSDSPQAVSKSVGRGVSRFAESYERLRPDWVVVLGDRFEILSAVVPAVFARVPVAHIHGGECTFGAFDDALRHAITKMSLLHFTSAEEHRQRVIQMGEDPQRVFNVGAIGLDQIRRLDPLPREVLERELGFTFGRHNLLVTFHPATLDQEDPQSQFEALLEALDGLEETRLIFTKANSDPGGREINERIDAYTAEHPDKAVVFTSLGQRKYLSMMREVDAVVGNSSSGLIEAPSFRIGTINIGDRQEGRPRAESVLSCAAQTEEIRQALSMLYSEKFRKRLIGVVNPYGDGQTAGRIRAVIKNYEAVDLKKKFFEKEAV